MAKQIVSDTCSECGCLPIGETSRPLYQINEHQFTSKTFVAVTSLTGQTFQSIVLPFPIIIWFQPQQITENPSQNTISSQPDRRYLLDRFAMTDVTPEIELDPKPPDIPDIYSPGHCSNGCMSYSLETWRICRQPDFHGPMASFPFS